jgi:beta-phosphoglucomutase-like phosphatase (HAD superfamily)
MGLFRKMTSMSTLGAVDFRSDKERIAKSGAQTAKQAKEQTKLLEQQLTLQKQQHPMASLLASQPGQPPMPSVADRLAQLDSLLAQRLVTSQEHADRRAAVLNSI